MSGLFVVTPTGPADLSTRDLALVRDLARQGLVVTNMARSDERFIVATRNARGLPLVGVVTRSDGEHDHVFARLMTKVVLG